MKYLIVLLCTCMVLLLGCAQSTVKPVVIPRMDDNPEAFACEADDDCVLQGTSCNNCDCPIAIHKDYVQPLHCKYDPEELICNLFCPPSTPKCIDSFCRAIEEDI